MSDAAWLMGYFGSLAEDGDAEADGDGTISRNGHMAGANPESGVDCGVGQGTGAKGAPHRAATGQRTGAIKALINDSMADP